jgi:hypothetical protein
LDDQKIMDKETRNTLRNAVTQCRRILEEAVGERLEGQYGIHASGKIEADAHMGHLSRQDADYRGQLLVHVGHIQAGGYTAKEAVAQLAREVAFTHLNRLVAYKMMERRGLIREAVSRGVKSQGFLFYLADHPQEEQLWSGGQPEMAYRHFLEWLGRTFAEEIRPLFAPHDPANPLFPPPRALDEVLALLNAPELADIWDEDETIGWVYQYFTPDELRRAARAASSAPRNSYELAFRNQFYTPRYVVEFLSDNTLGRIWYEMRQGDTRLTGQCRYLVRRPHELFLAEGEEAPVNIDQSAIRNPKSEIVPIPFRRKKDPRQLKILDPAGGSGHFLLYCFDLLVTIYEEAYDDPQLGSRLRADYPTLADLRRALPGLILRHNLHLIDIDRRATQIAALALWLRAQRAYQEWQIPAERRPPIRKANIVCAEPMPGDKKLLAEFVAGLNPPLLGQLVRTVFEKMTLAGEAGSLLKIEVELRGAIAAAKKEWEAAPKAKQLTLFAAEPQPEQLGFDLSGISDAEFWDKAEGLVLQALADYAEQAANGKGLARRLFAEDALQGFDFIDLLQKRFDVILMNPPFGAKVDKVRAVIDEIWQVGRHDLATAFVQLAEDRLDKYGLIGFIITRTPFSLSRYSEWREKLLFQPHCSVQTFVDFKQGVLDAMVETAIATLGGNYLKPVAFDCRQSDLSEVTPENFIIDNAYFFNLESLQNVPNKPLAYWVPDSMLQRFITMPLYGEHGEVKQGLATRDNEKYVRAWWEVPMKELGINRRWRGYAKGGEYARFYLPLPLVVDWSPKAFQEYKQRKGQMVVLLTNKREKYLHRPGITYSKRSQVGFSARILQSENIFSPNGPGVFAKKPEFIFYDLAFLNSKFSRVSLEFLTSFGSYSEGYIESLAYPDFQAENLAYSEIITISQKCTELCRKRFVRDETAREFEGLFATELPGSLVQAVELWEKLYDELQQKLQIAEDFLETHLTHILNLTDSDQEFLNQYAFGHKEEFGDYLVKPNLMELPPVLLSWGIGMVWGRWDIYNPSCDWNGVSSGLLDPLPICSLGMLQNENGLPITQTPENYPIEIDWDGILVDDPDHPDDIVRRVQQVLAVIWGERAAAIEQEACAILGVKELRDYFRKSGKGGFWDDHVKRYSKSRRKAPIYWLLQSSKGNYALWLYYHRLDKDLYYKALVNYVEPKLRLEENKLSQLQSQRAAFGTGGAEAKQMEKEIARQEAFLSELRDFHDKLRAVAHLNLDPDLNDGVILNIAPLRELVPWKEAAKMWDELQAGKYEWSSIGKQL